MKDVDVGIATRVGAATGDDGPRLQVRLVGKKKVAFDIVTKIYTFFDAKDVIKRNLGKLPIINMPSDFDLFVEARPSP